MSTTPQTASRYTAPAIAIHWLIALLIFGGFGLGWFMSDLPLSPQKLKFYSWHKWIGVTVFMLVLLRAGWRVTHKPPPLEPGLPTWQRFAAHGTHGLLYLLMFAIPLSGWTYSSASGYTTVYLGLVELPNLVAKSKPLAGVLHETHELLNYSLAALVVLHVAAALKHHFIDRDSTLKRMLPWKA